MSNLRKAYRKIKSEKSFMIVDCIGAREASTREIVGYVHNANILLAEQLIKDVICFCWNYIYICDDESNWEEVSYGNVKKMAEKYRLVEDALSNLMVVSNIHDEVVERIAMVERSEKELNPKDFSAETIISATEKRVKKGMDELWSGDFSKCRLDVAMDILKQYLP